VNRAPSIIVLVGLSLSAVASAQATPTPVVTHDRVLRDQTTTIALQLDAERVFCTAVGYSDIQLKISVPDLDWLGALDHRVEGETLPCMTGGLCAASDAALGEEGLTPADFIGDGPAVEIVPVRVVLIEHLVLDAGGGQCTRSLEEDVSATIQGHPFTHQAWGGGESVPVEVCQAIVDLP
jgi:hypothetical protein